MPKPPLIGLYVVTCPGRETVLSQTLASIRESDWPGDPVVLTQPADWPVGWDSTSRMYRTVLQRAWDDRAWWAVVLEDDVFVNRHLWQNLTNWHPMTTGQLHWGSLFIPDTIQDPWQRECPELHYRLARPSLVYGPGHLWQKFRLCGSQAYVFSRGGLGVFLQHWDAQSGGQDARVLNIVHQEGWPLWYSFPCLVEHNQLISAFGTPPIYAPDFAPGLQFSPPAVGAYRHPEGVPGWLSYREGRLLWELARGRRVLELGRRHGRSTVALAQSAKSLLSIDPLKSRSAREWLARFELTGAVDFREGSFRYNLPASGKFDLIFLDGEHDAKSVRRDLRLAHAALKPKGLLAVHDYPDPNWPDVRRGVDAAAREHGWRRVAQADYLGVFQT
ncbi:class I SAM-dependent methyltransferase [Limnoglobus roseus]|uniref:Class I SAM-dependent methyltransferase n=1 Tax=Limnoglobus roseus TaxID=2598579 RepID=A0A5C1AN46_9BACT|nr:class I SAM-dependent methyltransferase [Limnoglobus roseus]QEL19995.1 class I SAM-dependent methyltransferase [Limnoglobus roseus]